MEGVGEMNPLSTRAFFFLLGVFSFVVPGPSQTPVKETIEDSRQKVVKVYGAGGLAGLESYQSGFLVSPEGHIATAWSYVLDVDPVVILNDGRRFQAEVIGFQPQFELAVLKIQAGDLPFFSVKEQFESVVGLPVLAISNLFNIATGNEPASVMQGYVAGKTKLNARRGVFESAYRGEVLVLDLVANNPGAAGGALVTREGKLVGMLGKELRDSRSGAWLNYALPVAALRSKLLSIISGEEVVEFPDDEMLPRDKSHNFETLGLLMIPDVLDDTPAYIDDVKKSSAAHRGGLKSDDLILMVGNVRIENQGILKGHLRRIDRRDDVQLLVQRGTEILSLTLRP